MWRTVWLKLLLPASRDESPARLGMVDSELLLRAGKFFLVRYCNYSLLVAADISLLFLSIMHGKRHARILLCTVSSGVCGRKARSFMLTLSVFWT